MPKAFRSQIKPPAWEQSEPRQRHLILDQGRTRVSQPRRAWHIAQIRGRETAYPLPCPDAYLNRSR